MGWQVLDDTPLPPEPEIVPRPLRVGRGSVVGACLLLLLTALAVSGRARVAEARLRSDLGAAVATEERALRGGQVEQAPGLSHPALMGEWPVWYASTFRRVTEPLPLPTLQGVEWDGGTALVTLGFEQGEQRWQEVRAYRLLNGRWRRLPVPEGRWGLAQAYHSEHFTLWLAPRDAAVLPPETLLAELEAFHAALAAQWSLRAEDSAVEVRLVADETLTEPGVEPGRVRLRSPLLVPFTEGTALSRARAEWLALFGAVAATLDIPPRPPRMGSIGLRAALRDTLVRRLVLSPMEQAAFDTDLRAGWKATQPNESDLPRPDTPLFAAFVGALGADTPRQLADTVMVSPNYEGAIGEALGESWGTLRYAWARWLWAGEAPRFGREPGGIEGGQLVAAIPLGQPPSEGPSPAWRLTLRAGDGTQADVLGTAALQIPPPSCLQQGTEATWHFDAAGNVDELRLGPMRLDPWAIAPPPPDAHTMFLRPVQGGSSLLVLDRVGQEIELARLPANVVAVTDGASDIPRFAFLAADECGTSVNVYSRERDLLLRAALPPLAAPTLFWDGSPFPLIVDQKSGDAGEPWQVYAVEEGWESALNVYEQARGTTGRVLGFSAIRGRMVVQTEAGLHWAYPSQTDALVPLPLEGTGNIEVGTLAPGGRWLVYTVHHVGGNADLLALDLVTERTTWLDSLPPSIATGEMRAAPGDALRLATVQGSLGEEQRGLSLVVYAASLPTDPPHRVEVSLPNEVSALLWCPIGERLLLENDEGNPALLQWQAGSVEVLAAGGGQPLWCR